MMAAFAVQKPHGVPLPFGYFFSDCGYLDYYETLATYAHADSQCRNESH